MLPERDSDYLAEHWPGHVVQQDGGMVAVVLPRFTLPEGWNPRAVDMLLRLQFGYPEVAPDMFWTDPGVTLWGYAAAATEHSEMYLGRHWMRFSRHLSAGMWRPGIDDLRSYISLINTMLMREARQSPHRTAAA